MALLLPAASPAPGLSLQPLAQEVDASSAGDMSPKSNAEIVSAPEPSTETLFIHGGRIYLGNRDGGVVEALLVENGRVIAAGTEKRLRARLPEVGANTVDLKGAIAIPGIQDAHVRVERLGESLDQLNLRGVTSLEEMVEQVAKVAESTPKGEWIQGAGWDHRLWEDPSFPHHAALSAAVPDHPVLLWRVDGFSALVNEHALELAEMDEILDPVPRVQGGRIVVDEESRATGFFIDTATKWITKRMPSLEEGDIEKRILRAQDFLLAEGITCVHDMGVSPEALATYASLRERGLLRLRVVAYVDGNQGFADEIFESLPWRPDDLDLLSVPGVSFRLDGDLGTRSAALIADYSDDEGNRGHLLLTGERFTQLLNEAWRSGLQPAVHAVGDRANRVALDAFELMMQVDDKFSDCRPRVEQAQVISSRDIPRFPAMHVIPSMLPTQTLANFAWIESRLGPNRSRGTYAWRSLAPGLMQLAFGTGQPFEGAGPLKGIYAARIRRDHEALFSDGTIGTERLDGSGALAGFTRGPAHAAHQENRRGELIPGFWADLTVLDQDPIDGDPETLSDAKVLLTIINGRVVYQP